MQKYTTAQRLNQIATERNLKQVDIMRLTKPFCEQYKLKIGRNDLSQYFSGKVEPRQNKLFVLAKALGVSEAWLMGFDVPMERVDDSQSEQSEIDESVQLSIRETNLITKYRQLDDDSKDIVDIIVDREYERKNKVIDYANMVYTSEQNKK